MAGKASKPSFFWQGVLILLPVAGLALASVVSLRRDEQNAERDERQRAEQSVHSLAEVTRITANDELQRFLSLQNAWTGQLYTESWPNMVIRPDLRVDADVSKWEQDYPGFKLPELATREAKVLQDGREIDPPDTPIAPVPPKWFLELSPRERDLWESLRQKVAANQDSQAARDAFVRGGSLQAASNLQLLRPGNFNNGSFGGDAEYSESGISFRGIALGRALRDPSIPLSNSVQRPFWSEIIERPSFVAPMLLEMAEARTNGADPVICEKLRCMRQLWEIQSKEREWLESLRYAPELKEKSEPSNSWARWTTGSTGEVLAFGLGFDLEGVAFSEKGSRIQFIPGEVVKAIFEKALVRNKFLIPDFAQATVAVDGNSLLVPPDVKAGENESVLGTATGNFGPAAMPDAAGFEIKFLLTSREKMFSSERRRARLFALLVLGAVAAALFGFVSARWAFRTQLQLNDDKSNFVSSVSHELRAPIASVRLMAESLERGKVSEAPKQNEYFRFIVQECRRLSSLIENVLDFSRIEQGRKQYEFEPTDLVALTRETVKLMEPYAAEKGVVLETSNIEHRTSNIEIEIDGLAMQQALVNLMDNAMKHSPKEGVIKIAFECDGHFARLWVEDHGPGIPPEEHEKIFERFYRLGSELRRETQGVGIGLSIVRHIVEAHGGNVTVRSSVGQGSRFTIELPANNAKTQSSAKDL